MEVQQRIMASRTAGIPHYEVQWAARRDMGNKRYMLTLYVGLWG